MLIKLIFFFYIGLSDLLFLTHSYYIGIAFMYTHILFYVFSIKDNKIVRPDVLYISWFVSWKVDVLILANFIENKVSCKPWKNTNNPKIFKRIYYGRPENILPRYSLFSSPFSLLFSLFLFYSHYPLFFLFPPPSLKILPYVF